MENFNTSKLKRLALLSTETDEFQTSFTESPYDDLVYLATQSHHLETPHNKGATHKGSTIFCYDMSGNCVWVSEHDDKDLESFTFIIPLKNGMVMAAAKMVKKFDIGTMPKFYGKLFAIDKQGTVVQTYIMDSYHYVQLTSGVETTNNHFMVFGQTKDKTPHGEITHRGWQCQINDLGYTKMLELDSSLNGSFDFIKKSSGVYISAGIGIHENTNTYSPVIRKTSAIGKIEWEEFVDNSNPDEIVYSLAVDELDNIYLASATKESQGNFLHVYKFDSNGKKIWHSKQTAAQFGRPGVSLLLENNFCYAFSVQYGSPMNIHYHCLRSDDGKLVDNNEIGPLNTFNAPLISHNKSMLLVIGNGLDAEDNMDIWIDSIPIERL